MIRFFFTLFLFLSCYTLYSQDLPRKPLTSDVRSYNQSNLLKINIGMVKSEVIEKMGGISSIQTYWRENEKIGSRYKGDKINNPYSRDLKTDNNGTPIEILWYYTDLKSKDGAIRKDELTPIILESNKVVGLGWGFYEDYSRRKDFNINLNN